MIESRWSARLESVLIGLVIVTVAAFVWRWMDALGDTFWYLATGRWIIEHSRLPERDPFTFAATEVPWTVRMPLAHVLFALVELLAGLRGVLAFATLVEAAALLVVWLGTASGSARWWAFPLLPLLVYLARDDLCARGQVIGDLAFALLVWLTMRFARGEAQLEGWKNALQWVAPVLLGSVWMSSHPSALLGWVMVPVYVVALRAAGPVVAWRSLLAFYVLFVLGTLITPYGPGLVFEAAHLFVEPSTRSIDLFKSPDFRRPDVLAVLALATVVLAWGVRQAERLNAGDLLWLVALMLASLTGRRYLPLLGLLTLACLGRLLDDVEWLDNGQVRRLGVRVVAAVSSVGMAIAGAAPRRSRGRRRGHRRSTAPASGLQPVSSGGLPCVRVGTHGEGVLRWAKLPFRPQPGRRRWLAHRGCGASATCSPSIRSTRCLRNAVRRST